MSWLDESQSGAADSGGAAAAAVTGGAGEMGFGGSGASAAAAAAGAGSGGPDLKLASAQAQEIAKQLRQQLRTTRADADVVRALCVQLGFVPDDVRGAVWTHLLGMQRHDAASFSAAWAQPMDLPSQDMLQLEARVACRNVLSGEEAGPGAPPPTPEEQLEMLEDMQLVLTAYCKRRDIDYPQGLSDLIAPLHLLSLPQYTLYNCFYKLCATYCPRLMHAREAGGDTVTMAEEAEAKAPLLRLLMQYHDPPLSSHLEQQTPDWFRPLHKGPRGDGAKGAFIPIAWTASLFEGHTLTPAQLLPLWDQLLLPEQHDSDLRVFIVLAVIVGARAGLLAAHGAAAAETLRDHLSEALQTPAMTAHFCTQAVRLQRSTPQSFRHRMRQVAAVIADPSLAEEEAAPIAPEAEVVAPKSSTSKFFASLKAPKAGLGGAKAAASAEQPVVLMATARHRVQAAQESFCMQISPNDVLPHLCATNSAVKDANGIRYFVVDCRAGEDIAAQGAFPTAFHLEPEILQDAERLSDVLTTQFKPLKGYSHICLMGSGAPQTVESAAVVSSEHLCALMLAKEGYPLVSSVEGGFAAVFAILQDPANPFGGTDVLIGGDEGGSGGGGGGGGSAASRARATSASVKMALSGFTSSSKSWFGKGKEGMKGVKVDVKIGKSLKQSLAGVRREMKEVAKDLKFIATGQVDAPPPPPVTAEGAAGLAAAARQGSQGGSEFTIEDDEDPNSPQKKKEMMKQRVYNGTQKGTVLQLDDISKVGGNVFEVSAFRPQPRALGVLLLPLAPFRAAARAGARATQTFLASSSPSAGSAVKLSLARTNPNGGE